jgi:hypothetical protein
MSQDMILTFSGVPYRVVFTPAMSGLGDTDKYATLIRVQEGLTREKEYSVILHEALHAMLDEEQVLSKTELDNEEGEERIVARLEVALRNFIRENPDFIVALLMTYGPPEYQKLAQPVQAAQPVEEPGMGV